MSSAGIVAGILAILLLLVSGTAGYFKYLLMNPTACLPTSGASAAACATYIDTAVANTNAAWTATKCDAQFPVDAARCAAPIQEAVSTATAAAISTTNANWTPVTCDAQFPVDAARCATFSKVDAASCSSFITPATIAAVEATNASWTPAKCDTQYPVDAARCSSVITPATAAAVAATNASWTPVKCDTQFPVDATRCATQLTSTACTTKFPVDLAACATKFPTQCSIPLSPYTEMRGYDMPGGDIKSMTGSIDQLRAACTATPGCIGFNSLGYLKNNARIVPVAKTGVSMYFPDNKVYNYANEQLRDSSGSDIVHLIGQSEAQLKAYCNANPDCMGFNSAGYMKNKVTTPLTATTSYNFYTKGSLVTPPASLQSRMSSRSTAAVTAMSALAGGALWLLVL